VVAGVGVGVGVGEGLTNSTISGKGEGCGKGAISWEIAEETGAGRCIHKFAQTAPASKRAKQLKMKKRGNIGDGL